MTSESMLILLAVGVIVFCVAMGIRMRQRGDWGGVGGLLIGVPGVYLSGYAAIEGPSWLFVPSGGMVAASYAFEFLWARRREAANPEDR